ncbi:MAG: GIY-YIG nuclease family protein [bacterium]|nr:GIY-YIG nuclease family protein [bacterium]
MVLGGKMFITYILQSEKNGSYYIGSTQDLEERIKKHNTGQSKYTKKLKPWILVYTEKYGTLSEARRREMYLKSLKSKVAIEKLLINGPIV